MRTAFTVPTFATITITTILDRSVGSSKHAKISGFDARSQTCQARFLVMGLFEGRLLFEVGRLHVKGCTRLPIK